MKFSAGENIHVSYDPKQQRWIARNTSKSLCHKDQRKVLLWALKQRHPEIYRVIKTIAFFHRKEGSVSLALIDRLIRAAQLMTKGYVHSDGLVGSQNNNGQYYHVTFKGIPKRWACTCEDFKRGGVQTDYGQMCKHTFALLMAGFLQRDLLG